MEHICETCKFGCMAAYGYDITMTDDECGGCTESNDRWQPMPLGELLGLWEKHKEQENEHID